ncbi:MAG: DMT family transporter [Sneathiella sp.]|uniref:DMT family transporter n=1 Tax=Sneathiella sp. TaxID=1964365 RepID=UPI003002A130
MTIQLSDNMRGAAYMSISMAAFVLNDTTMKLAAEHLSMFQAMFLRGIFTTVLLGALTAYNKAFVFRIPKADRKTLILRLIGEIGGTVCFLTALFNMPIANATAILQALPLAVTLAGALFLKEIVGWRRYLAIAVGFIGVLIIVRPGSDGFNEFSLWAVAAVFFIVLRDLATRQLSPAIPSLFVSLLTSIAILLVGGILSFTMEWKPVTAEGLGLLSGAAVFVIFGYLFSVMAMRVGDISFSSPFRYTILLWAIILGNVVFGDSPDQWTIFGSLIIVGSGVYTFYRERLMGRRGRSQAKS